MLRAVAATLARRASAAGESALVAGTRGLAQAASKEIKLPPQHSVAGRYASALYLAAVKAGKLAAVESELVQVSELLSRSREFDAFVNDPSVSRKVKSEGLNAVLSKLNASDITKNFIGLLSENNRLEELTGILDKFVEVSAEQKGQVLATVTTAEGLTREEAAEVQAGLKQLLQPGQSLAVQEKVDPAIIGGVVIDIGDKHVDFSILSRVRKLQNIIRDAV